MDAVEFFVDLVGRLSDSSKAANAYQRLLERVEKVESALIVLTDSLTTDELQAAA